MAASLSSFDVATCVDRCGFATGCCETHCNGCMNVAWAMFWGGSRSTKPCVFPCKVAAADDERYLVCATGAAGVVSCANWFLLYVFCNEWLCPVCVVLCVSWSCGCRSHWNGCFIVVIWMCHVRRCAGLPRAKRIVMAAWMLHGLCFGEEAGARNLVFFHVKWLQPAMKGTSCVRRVRLGSFHARIGSSYVFCNEWLCPVCVVLCGFLKLVVADCIGMAALSSFDVATCRR